MARKNNRSIGIKLEVFQKKITLIFVTITRTSIKTCLKICAIIQHLRKLPCRCPTYIRVDVGQYVTCRGLAILTAAIMAISVASHETIFSVNI